VVLLVCFPAFAQVADAWAGKLARYDFRARRFAPVETREPGCFCDAECMQPIVRPYTPLSNRGGIWKAPDDIKAIDLEGLKKILQREPKETRPLLVNFWATWCDPCREEFPDLVKLDNDYRTKGLSFVAVSLDDLSDIKSAVPQFLKEMKATMPVVLLNVNDPEPAIKVVDTAWDGQLPATFLYDSQGKIIFKHFGRIAPLELRAAIDKELNRK